MKLGTLHDGTRDGKLVVVRADGQAYADATDIARKVLAALDDWDRAAPLLRPRAEALSAGSIAGEDAASAAWRSPLPRAYEWIDGSAYLNHVRLVRKARGAEPPPTLETDPLVYQGGSGTFLRPTEDIPLGARILTVVDYFDALTSDRPYHRAMDHDAALLLLEQESGKALDPTVVHLFFAHLPALAAEGLLSTASWTPWTCGITLRSASSAIRCGSDCSAIGLPWGPCSKLTISGCGWSVRASATRRRRNSLPGCTRSPAAG